MSGPGEAGSYFEARIDNDGSDSMQQQQKGPPPAVIKKVKKKPNPFISNNKTQSNEGGGSSSSPSNTPTLLTPPSSIKIIHGRQNSSVRSKTAALSLSNRNLTADDLNGVQQIRNMFVDDDDDNQNDETAVVRPTMIPADLDTDFNLRRWWYAFKGDVPEITRKLTEYMENRRAAGLDGGRELLTKYNEFDAVTRFMPYFDCSPLEHIIIDPSSNRIITVFRLEGLNYDHLINFMNSSDVMHCGFMAAELHTQRVLEQERNSGRPSGITAVIDCTNLSGVSQYVSPTSVASRLSTIVLQFFADWYSELVTEIIVFNPPFVSMVHLALKIATFLVPNITLKKISIAKNKAELQEWIPEIALKNTAATNNSNLFETTDAPGGPLPSKLADGMLLRPKIWPSYYVSNEKTGRPIADILHQVTLKPENTHADTLEFAGRPGARILWWFTWTGSGDVELTVQDMVNKHLMCPKFILASFKIPEEGFAHCDISENEGEGGEKVSYTLAVRNLSLKNTLQLTYAFEAVDRDDERIERNDFVNNCMKLLLRRDSSSSTTATATNPTTCCCYLSQSRPK